MKIGIIGFGFVGKALVSVLKKPGQVSIVDPKYNAYELTAQDLLSRNLDIIFLCLPTPTVDGKCDDSLILEHVELFKNFPGALVIKSTIPPHTVEKVLAIRPATVVWPELLRESNAGHDIKFPEVIVVGAPTQMQFDFVAKFVTEETEIMWERGQSPNKRSLIWQCSPVEASIFKYTVNSFLAMKTLFFHQMNLWMERSGRIESYNKVVQLLQQEGRIGKSHMEAPGEHGYGYAGTCFPKDVEAFIEQVYFKDLTTFPLLNEVHKQNEVMRNSPENSPEFLK